MLECQGSNAFIRTRLLARQTKLPTAWEFPAETVEIMVSQHKDDTTALILRFQIFLGICPTCD